MSSRMVKRNSTTNYKSQYFAFRTQGACLFQYATTFSEGTWRWWKGGLPRHVACLCIESFVYIGEMPKGHMSLPRIRPTSVQCESRLRKNTKNCLYLLFM
ncbi:hypothetical protein J6590_065530 [Homalodisca vitripennis]|nr:hypothetical protein J6590_065530 [Homalodisca vitripennis]